LTAPPATTAQEWLKPAAIWVTPGRTGTGGTVVEVVVVVVGVAEAITVLTQGVQDKARTDMSETLRSGNHRRKADF
jgi:hypothetical protein